MQFYKRLWVDSNLSIQDNNGFPWGLTPFKARKTKEIKRIFQCYTDAIVTELKLRSGS